MNRREIILDAVGEAHRLHDALNSEETPSIRGGGVDVFGAIRNLSISLIFRPLDNLLGAFLPPPLDGILVTSERNLAIQRFTASHELGHRVLGHKTSLDDSAILNRIPLGNQLYDLEEAAADAFAATFLIPDWVIEINAMRQGWSRESMLDPTNVYQLSLRIGASYEATCRQLYNYKIINWKVLEKHRSTSPKKIKQSLIPGKELDNWHPNIWLLSDRDQGTLIQGGPNDLFLFRLKEKSGSGYLWNFKELTNSGFALLANEVLPPENTEEIGGVGQRIILAHRKQPITKVGNVSLEQLRPWDQTSGIDQLNFSYELVKESGLSSVERRLLAA